MAVPYTFGSATTSIPLSQLDSNFSTAITLGNTAIQLGNTVTTLNNMTFANVTISSVSTAVTPPQGGTGLTTLTANNVLLGNGTSSVAFVAPGTSGNVLASNGTTWTSTALPAFSAYLGSTQNLTPSSNTKITINTKTFDTANAFDATTNYRFTPQVAGYYLITGVVAYNSTGSNPTTTTTQIYKNGSPVKSASGNNSGASYMGVATGVIYLNGSTDYVELYGQATGGSGTLYAQVNGTSYTYFDGVLVRAA